MEEGEREGGREGGRDGKWSVGEGRGGREGGREGAYRLDGLLGLHISVAVGLHGHNLPVFHHCQGGPTNLA